MRYKCIACEVLARPVYLAAANAPHIIDVSLVRYGLHTTPKKLRQTLQAHIDAADEDGDYDAVLLAYGLCGKATHGLQAGAVPLVLPRAHDCITLFLGGRRRYNQEFQACPGTYWYVQDFIERSVSSDVPLSIGAHTSANANALRETFVEKYGEDNADYLIEAMVAWETHYERAAFIDMGVGDGQKTAKLARDEAQRRGWRFETLNGDMRLITNLLHGNWEENFLKIAPGESIEMTGGDEIIHSVS